MAKKYFFDDLIKDDENLLQGYRRLSEEKEKVETPSDFVKQNENQPVSESKEPRPVSNVKRGRPRKVATVQEKKNVHIDISSLTSAKLRMYISYVSMTDGKRLTADQVISVALDHLIKNDCPDLMKNFKNTDNKF